jgi:hypothetical protein
MSGRAVIVAGIAVLIALSVAGLAAFELVARPTPLTAESGDLEAVVGDFVRRMPGPHSDGYVQPSPDEQSTMAAAARAIEDGRPQDADQLVGPLGYRVLRFLDSDTGRNLVALEPSSPAAPAWGMYVFAPDAPTTLIVEVPHPFDDLDTATVGVETFRAADGEALFIAGASRYAAADGIADMAHDSYTVFGAIHEAMLTSASVVFEPHGFETSGHPTGGDAVVSSGTDAPGAIARSVAETLKRSGYIVCLFDGGNCGDLGGTTNAQGQSARAAGATFLHLELSLRMRRSRGARVSIARAVEAALPR